MTPRKYLMISALNKQMKAVQEQAAKEKKKYDFPKPIHMWAVNKKWKQGCYWGDPDTLVGYVPTVEIPDDIAEEVLKFCKDLQTMKADEIYAAVLKKLLDEAKNMDGEGEK